MGGLGPQNCVPKSATENCWCRRPLLGAPACEDGEGGAGATEAQEMCRLALPGVRAGSGLEEDIASVLCPQTVGGVFLVGEGGTRAPQHLLFPF